MEMCRVFTRTRRWGSCLLAGVAIAAPLVNAEGVNAQQVAASSEQANPVSAETNGDIIVTARRRDEKIQDVPIAISAVSGEAMANRNITTVEQVRFLVPSLVVSSSPFGPSVPGYTIRGQRQLEQIISQDTSVGIYVADVVQQRPHGTNQTLYDLESIQVLKRPQGTLFGRSTTAAAVLLTPNQHKLANVDGSPTATAAKYDMNGDRKH